LVTALDELNTWGVQFVALKRGFDTTTAQGRLMFHVVASFAEFEREIIRERVISALETARLPVELGGKGKILGRPRKFVSVSRVRALRDSGASWRTIAKQTGVGVATVYRIAQRSASIPCEALNGYYAPVAQGISDPSSK
jgi:DNA invertase Pin-like site-specific DNA recombinase